MNSCLYEGSLRHRRFAPIENSFDYSLFMVYLDLAELDEVFACHSLWSTQRPNVAWFNRADHLGDPDQPLDGAVRGLIAEQTGQRHEGPIRLLTHLRYFGYGFNPVSFFYCFDNDDRLQTIVAEVNNTPWGEQHPYVLTKSLEVAGGLLKRYAFRKAFHVSPFMPMEQDYDWHFGEPDQGLRVHMRNLESGTRLFDSTMHLSRREISRKTLSSVLARFPFMTLKVIAAIYIQAAKLRWKGNPVHDHPGMEATSTCTVTKH